MDTERDPRRKRPQQSFNSLMGLTAAGGAIGIPGLYVTDDPGGVDPAAKSGSLSLRLGLGWAKSHSFATGQCPVMRYNHGLMMCILHDKVHIADAVNTAVIALEDAPRGYAAFDSGAAQKFVLDPNGYLGATPQ
jgi:glutathione-independent formaldehyde dehydrogenase